MRPGPPWRQLHASLAHGSRLEPVTDQSTVRLPLSPSRAGRGPRHHARGLRLIEPWYVSYGLLGAVAAGLIPILLPLAVHRTGGVAEVGLVMAAFGLGGLAAPVWGAAADRYRAHKILLNGGFVVLAVALVGLPLVAGPALRIALAFGGGVGAAAGATVGNLFIVERWPKGEWDERIGWLQTFYGAGQVGGLLLAGVLSNASVRVGFWVSAGLAAAAVLPGWWGTEAPPAALGTKPVFLTAPRYGEYGFGGPQRHYHHVTAATLGRVGRAVVSPFGVFLLLWLVSLAGSSAFYSLYPAIMEAAYGMAPTASATGFGVAAAIGLVVYLPAGAWADRRGPTTVVRSALLVRVVAFLLLFAIAYLTPTLRHLFTLPVFTLVVLAWSLLIVAGTALTARLSPVGEGEGMGILNAVTAIALSLGAVIGGWGAARWGYQAVPLIGVAGVGLGLALVLLLGRRLS